MKAQQLFVIQYKMHLIAFALFTLTGIFNSKKAYCQVDYTYGLNNSGVRIGAGVGLAALNTHFSQNPHILNYIGSLDYDFNPYLSVGLEGQYGTLQGIDAVHHLYYYSSTDKYFSGTANIRVGLGEFDDFSTQSRWGDALKKFYLGVGMGAIKTDNKLTVNDNTASTAYGSAVPQGKYLLIPINVGTNIDLLNVLGMDRISLNPNFQVNYVNSLFLDGFQSTQASTLKGFYNVVSVKLKYKF